MRTTIDIPQDLLQDAMQVSGARTKTMAIVLGLKELLHHHQIEKLRALKGRITLDVKTRSTRKR